MSLTREKIRIRLAGVIDDGHGKPNRVGRADQARVSMQSLIALRGPSKPRPVTRRNRIEWIVDEEIWRALLQKGKLREEATARKAKVLGGIVLVLLAFGSAFYLLAVR